MKARRDRWWLLIGVALILAGISCFAWGYMTALAGAFGSASGRGGGHTATDVLIDVAALCVVTGVAFVLKSAAGVFSRPDNNLVAWVWGLTLVVCYGLIARTLASDLDDCSLRRTQAICHGAPLGLLPPPEQRQISVPHQTNPGEEGVGAVDGEALARLLPAWSPAWISQRAVELDSVDLWIAVSSRWELAFFSQPPWRKGSPHDASWHLWVRERGPGTSERSWIDTNAPSRIIELSPDELLMMNTSDHDAMLLWPRLGRHDKLSLPLTASDQYLTVDADQPVVALPDGTTLLDASGGRLLGLSKNPRPRFELLRDASEPASFRLAQPRRRLIEVTDGTGAYKHSTWVTPPGATDAPIVAGDGFTCVGVPSGICLLPAADPSLPASLALRLRATFDLQVIAALLLVPLQLFSSLRFLRLYRQTRSAPFDESDPDALRLHTERRRRTMRLGLLSTALAIFIAALIVVV